MKRSCPCLQCFKAVEAEIPLLPVTESPGNNGMVMVVELI
jgi:hypothetical protein